MPTSAPLVQKPKTKQDKQSHARSVIRQILAEPVEIAKTATRQVAGGEWKEQTTVQKPQTGEQPAFGNEEQDKKIARDKRYYEAFQNELIEIRKIQKQRAQNLARLRAQEEQKQAQAEQAKKKEQEGLVEPITRKARGLLGGAGAMLGVKRKQRSTELAKTPSN